MEYSFQKNKMTDAIDSDDKFWEGLEEGVFRLCRCAGCKVWMWPLPNFRCGECGSWDQEWVEVEPQGIIYSWIRTWSVFDQVAERKDDIPYVTLTVEVGGAGGPRLVGVLKGSEDGLRVGAPVYGSIDPPSPKTKGYAAVRWRSAGR